MWDSAGLINLILCRGRRHERAYGQNPYWFRAARLNFAENVLLSGNENDHSVYYAHFPHVCDESVLLFLKMKDGERFTDGLVERVKRGVRDMCRGMFLRRGIYG
jgi:hypothetical protein